MKKIILLLPTVFCLLQLLAQNIIPVYYSPVSMPVTLKNNYYGLFDTKLMAEDLSILLHKATGKSYTAMEYVQGADKGIFLILDSSKTNFKNEEGLLENNGKDAIHISGRYTTGISYTLYSWLEELGFHFYLPGDEWAIIPSLNTVFNANEKKTYSPYFKIRMFNSSGSASAVKGLDEKNENAKEWQQWWQRNRMGCDYLSIDGHIGAAFNIANRKEIESDSMIVAPVNGRRMYNAGDKLDPTYKKGVALFSDWIVSQFNKSHLTAPSFLPFKKYFTVDAGDGYGYCHTPECEKQFKSVSDQVFSIANETAEKIKQADPRAGVSSLAYTERADTPSISLKPNVHVMVVATAFQSVTTTADLLQRWAKKTSNLSMYDYLNIPVWSYDKPFFNMYSYFGHLQFLQSLNYQGITYETSLSKFGSGIQQYFILKFLCEPYASVDNVLNEFCKNNFGNAAQPIKKLLKEWYFSDLHLRTGFDYPSFYEEELGRFIGYLLDAENSAGLSPAVKTRIGELKAYTVYLCKYYELFADLKNLQSYSADISLRNDKTDEILIYTWKLYNTKIFQNAALNDLLIHRLPDEQKLKWDYRKSSLFNGITNDVASVVKNEFEKAKQKYLPLAQAAHEISDSFLLANIKYSADSIRISTTDETTFHSFICPLEFYCGEAGILKVNYEAGASAIKNSGDKIAIVAVESNDYKFINNYFVYADNSNGSFSFRIPVKGHYRLFLSQYNSTHIVYRIYPGKNLFYYHKNSLPLNGLSLQDYSDKNSFQNKYLAVYTGAADSMYFSNLYFSATNTAHLFSASGAPIAVTNNSRPFCNTAVLPKNNQPEFIFYQNTLIRWPMVLKSSAPYYFFFKYPLK